MIFLIQMHPFLCDDHVAPHQLVVDDRDRRSEEMSVRLVLNDPEALLPIRHALDVGRGQGAQAPGLDPDVMPAPEPLVVRAETVCVPADAAHSLSFQFPPGRVPAVLPDDVSMLEEDVPTGIAHVPVHIAGHVLDPKILESKEFLEAETLEPGQLGAL